MARPINAADHTQRMVHTLTVRKKIGLWVITLIVPLSAIILGLYGPIPQSLSYHAFADKRTIWGIPHFLDVISNLAFILVGSMGLYESLVRKTILWREENRSSYIVFFIGVALVGVGSGFYHLAPSNASLVWDRIPMTIAIMALVSIVIGEYVSARWASILLFPLLAVGILSVVYWYWTESTGNGDLRPYALVQFLPMIVIPVILLCFDSASTTSIGYWLLLSAYVIAKIFEHFDSEIFSASGWASGHTLKHLTAAVGIYLLLMSFRQRATLNEPLHSS